MDRRALLGSLLLLAVFAGIIYANILDGQFQFDDYTSIVENPAIEHLDPLALWQFWPGRIVAYSTFAVDYQLHGLHVRGYHLGSIFVHLLVSFTVLLLVLELLRREEPAPHRGLVALSAALVFLAHPLQTQAVDYIVQRTAALCALFYLASIATYLRAHRPRPPEGRRWGWSAISIVFAVLASFTKEIAITLPLAILLVDLATKLPSVGRWRRWWPYAVVMILIGGITLSQHRFGVGGGGLTGETDAVGPFAYWSTQWEVVTRYLGLVVWPARQNVDHEIAWRGGPLDPSAWPWLVPHILLLLAAFLLWRHGLRLLSLGILWLYLCLLPESSVFPIRDPMFEHRMYLPMFGPALLLGFAIRRLHRSRARGSIAVLLALSLLLGDLSHQRNRVWASPLTLWSDAVAKSPGKSRPYLGLGQALGRAGNLAQAERALRKAVALDPSSYKGWTNLGNVLLATSRLEEAAAAYQRAVSIKADHVTALYDLAVCLGRMGKMAASERAYARVLELDGNHGGALNGMAALRLRQGRITEAAVLADRAARAGHPAAGLRERIRRARSRDPGG